MKRLLAILLLCSAALAVDPVTPIQTVWTVQPVTVELLNILVDPAQSPERVRVVLERMTPEEIIKVAVSLADNPQGLQVLVSQLDPAKLAKVNVALFLADTAAWARVSEFMSAVPAVDPAKNPFAAGWLDAGRERLRKKITKEGYTPELLAEAEALMARAAQPEKRGTLDQIKGK